MVIKPDFDKMLNQLNNKENIEVYDSFEQEWGNGGTGFVAPWQACAQAFTKTNVTILKNNEKYFVFINNELCYQADKGIEIEHDIKEHFIRGRYEAKGRYKNVYWTE